MIKSLSIGIAIVAVMLMFASCKKEVNNSTKQEYAKFVSGEVLIKEGDVSLKSVPVGITRYLYTYKGVVGSLALVDGSEFLPESAANIFWLSSSNNNPSNFLANVSVHSSYIPAMQIRMIAKTVDVSSKPAYLGIWDGIPTAASFPITIQGRRLGDVLTLNTDALTALPGYTNMSFDVVYTKSLIDVNQTALTSPITTTDWPVYVYSSSSTTTTTLDATKNGGLRTIYDDVDAKITGTITINIHVDNTIITVTTPAPVLGHGLALTLKTTKIGWYDSATMGITDQPITVDSRDLTIN